MNPCKIVQDLLPLFVEDVCSKSSREYVEAHLAECDECLSLLSAMNTDIQGMSTQQSAKKSFSNFRKKMMWRRIGWTAASLALCAVLYIALVFSPFMQQEHAIPLEAISTSVSRLSDGSVHILFESTKKPLKFYAEYTYLLPEDPYTLCIRCYHTYNNDFNLFPFALNRKDTRYIFMTEESAPLYDIHLARGHLNDMVHKIVLMDEDSERVLWEKGDILPPADAQAEYRLQQTIEYGYIVPIDTP